MRAPLHAIAVAGAVFITGTSPVPAMPSDATAASMPDVIAANTARPTADDTGFIVVPIPVINPAIGTGGALASAFFFKFDETSASSLIGAGGFYTNNGSWGAAAMTTLAFNEDRYRLRAVAAYAHVTYDFFGFGFASRDLRSHVAVSHSGYGFTLRGEFRVAPKLYVGSEIRYADIKTTFGDPVLADAIVGERDATSTVASLGIVATYDTRNADYSPSSGQIINGAISYSAHQFLSREHYLRITASYNRYDSLSSKLVLASRLSLCEVDGRAPIYDLCLFGSQNDIRGYAVGEFQNKAMIALQSEARWRPFRRWGFVAFAGIGSVAQSLGEFKYVLAAGGAGVRFVASQTYGVNVGIDAAINKNGDKTIYFQVGEAF